MILLLKLSFDFYLVFRPNLQKTLRTLADRLKSVVGLQGGSLCSRTTFFLTLLHFLLKFCNRLLVYATSALWNGLPKDLRQFARPPIPPLNFTSPPLVLSSASSNTRLKTELFKLSHHYSAPLPPQHVSHRRRL